MSGSTGSGSTGSGSTGSGSTGSGSTASGSIGESLRRRLIGLSDRQTIEALFAFMLERGQAHYDESVTQIEHALQCAQLAREQGEADPIVTAALFHDIGHLLLDEHHAETCFRVQDLNHEELGADFLAALFPQSVTELIRLHVPAKRYLCTIDADYYGQLSDASQRSFKLQGSKLSSREQAQLEQNSHLQASLTLRRLDDEAKVVGKATPGIEDFTDPVLRCLVVNGD